MSHPKASEFSSEETCSECSGVRVNGMNCWEQFGGILAWEAQDAELAAEHFKTVACYNLQHPAQFTDEAIAGLKSAFIEHIDHGLPVQEIRRRFGKTYNGKKPVLKKESERKMIQRHWPMTVAQVYLFDQSQNAAQRVRDWAKSIRESLTEGSFEV